MFLQVVECRTSICKFQVDRSKSGDISSSYERDQFRALDNEIGTSDAVLTSLMNPI